MSGRWYRSADYSIADGQDCAMCDAKQTTVVEFDVGGEYIFHVCGRCLGTIGVAMLGHGQPPSTYHPTIPSPSLLPTQEAAIANHEWNMNGPRGETTDARIRVRTDLLKILSPIPVVNSFINAGYWTRELIAATPDEVLIKDCSGVGPTHMARVRERIPYDPSAWPPPSKE